MPDHVTSDIREFIWEIGNGTTEAALCDTLQGFYHILCPLAELLAPDEPICEDIYRAYKNRCSWGISNHAGGEDTFLYIAVILIFCLTIISILKTKQILYLPESAITIFCGVFTGLVFVAGGQRPNQAYFNSDIFFEVLLPFIIFESGYNMEKKLFEKNFFEIVLLAIFGTFGKCCIFFAVN